MFLRQLLPLYVVQRLNVPCLPGLFTASVFSGALRFVLLLLFATHTSPHGPCRPTVRLALTITVALSVSEMSDPDIDPLRILELGPYL